MGHVPLEIRFNALYMYNNLPILMWSLTSLKIYLVGTVPMSSRPTTSLRP